MKTEIEVKFCRVDVDATRTSLEQAGAILEQPMRLMRRTVFYAVDRDPNAYLRIRDEGGKTTMAYKTFVGTGIHDAMEAETIVGEYDVAIEVLKQIGLEAKSVQETRRETWRLGAVEIVIDEWPWLEPFVEIEGDSEEAVRVAAEALRFDWADAVIGPVTVAYRLSYPDLPQDVVMDDVPDICFNADTPERLYGR